MRIAWIVPSLGVTEGQGNVNFELLTRVVAAGHDVEIISSLVPERVRSLNVKVHDVARTRVQLVNQRLMIAAANRRLRKTSYDIVHADGPVTTAPVDVAMCHMPHAAWLRLPADARREHGVRGALNALATAMNVRLERRVYTTATRVLVASELTANVLQESGVDPVRIKHLPFGIDATRFRPPTGDERRAARRAFGIEHGEFCVLFIGAQGPRKGLPALVAAVDASDRLLAVGDRRHGDQERVAHERGLRAVFSPKLDDVRPAYWAADVFVAPSRFDAFGLSILEAMACGIPVVTSRASGAAGIVGEGGIVVDDPTDVAALSRAIADVRADALLRARLGATGRAVAQTRSWDDAGEVLLKVYQEALDAKSGTPVEAR
ncbi:MAG: glycosyltransferase family 4 protein [Actinobacteria bacterium]|nr:glycosyltransferase family 4 protein [Actinomycetota bacterium]